MMMRSALYQTNTIGWISQCQLTETTAHSDPLSRFRVNQSLLFLLKLMLRAQRRSFKCQFYSLLFELIGARSHANHYTMDAVTNNIYINLLLCYAILLDNTFSMSFPINCDAKPSFPGDFIFFTSLALLLHFCSVNSPSYDPFDHQTLFVCSNTFLFCEFSFLSSL